MYIPPAFVESDVARLHAFIEANSFGLLVSEVDGVPFATHLPFLLRRTDGPQGSLIGHMARANPQWQHFAARTVLAIFSGPHAYISPTWYEAENVVPTWNYLAVHVYGRVHLLEDESSLRDLVEDTVAVYERTMPRPWSLEPTDESFVRRLLAQIVGFRIEITKLEGKFKLNQNHPVDRQEKVAAALQAAGGENNLALAIAMQANQDAKN